MMYVKVYLPAQINAGWQTNVTVFMRENVPKPSRRKESEDITRADITIQPSQLVTLHLPPASNCLLPLATLGPPYLSSACSKLWPAMALTLAGSLVKQVYSQFSRQIQFL